MNWLRRFFSGRKGDETPAPPTDSLTEDRIDMSFRVFWTKICRDWPIDRVQQVQAQVRSLTQQPDFEKNLIERRYAVPGLVDGGQHQTHSGASLLALLEVLATLERMYTEQQEA
jgi:hypothetical protein